MTIKSAIHIFGSSSLIGQEIYQYLSRNSDFEVFCYSRSQTPDNNTFCLDLQSPFAFDFSYMRYFQRNIFLSCCPIWTFSSFLSHVLNESTRLSFDISFVCCLSSSSVVTKSFSSSAYDINLVQLLSDSEKSISSQLHSVGIPLTVLRPSIIYADFTAQNDRNYSNIYSFFGLPFPFPILVPSPSGLRQPIHVKQLAQVVVHFVNEFSFSRIPATTFLSIGGDDTLSVYSLLSLIKNSRGSFLFSPFLIKVPHRFYFFLISPFALFAPKIFFELLRFSANLSGFTPCSDILRVAPRRFPFNSCIL